MRILLLYLIGFFTGQVLFAQAIFPEIIQEEEEMPGIIKRLYITKDKRLDKMLNWHIEKNKTINGIDGFRVEIFSSSNFDAKEKAEAKKIEFLLKYPDNIVYVKYFAPNFRVRIGDFRTKNEALKLHNQIKENYTSSFIVSEIIEFPLLKPLHYE